MHSVGQGTWSSWVSDIDYISSQVLQYNIRLYVSSVYKMIDLTVAITDCDIISYIKAIFRCVSGGHSDTEGPQNGIVFFVFSRSARCFINKIEENMDE